MTVCVCNCVSVCDLMGTMHFYGDIHIKQQRIIEKVFNNLNQRYGQSYIEDKKLGRKRAQAR